MKRKILPVLIALVLMIVIAAGAVGTWLAEKYAYGTEIMDLKTYFRVEDGERIIYLGTQRTDEKAYIRNGICYLSLSYVRSHINDTFYVDYSNKLLLYTDAVGTISSRLEENIYSVYGQDKAFEGQISILQGDGLYLALPFVAMFSPVEYHLYDYALQLITQPEEQTVAQLSKDTKVRYRAGIKSEILRDVAQGETVQIVEPMENWSKVRTRDCVEGYVENKFLQGERSETAALQPVSSDYQAPEYTVQQMSEKVCLGWHAIGGVGGNSTLEEMVYGSKGMNVIAPTWFSLNDNEGGFRNFGEASYVERAHKYGLKVWGTVDDFNFENETGTNIDDTLILSSTPRRWNLVKNIADTAESLGLDGVNVDFEKVGSDCREHYAQFLRELSVECRNRNITLSVDNYMPNEGNKQYRLDVQGKVVDYVVLMGYDEHWHGSGNPGSVASIGFVTDGITKALESVPADKLINAVPLYTIVWRVEGAAVTDEYLTLVNQADFLNRIGQTPVWDDNTCQNYVEWSSETKTQKVWLEDLDSIRVKLNVMSANHLAGVAAWRLGYGTPEIWSLLSAFKLM